MLSHQNTSRHIPPPLSGTLAGTARCEATRGKSQVALVWQLQPALTRDRPSLPQAPQQSCAALPPVPNVEQSMVFNQILQVLLLSVGSFLTGAPAPSAHQPVWNCLFFRAFHVYPEVPTKLLGASFSSIE